MASSRRGLRISALRAQWPIEAVQALGATTDIPTAASIFGLSLSGAYALHARGDFPVDVINVGWRLVVPVAPILKLLAITPDTGAATEDSRDAAPEAQRRREDIFAEDPQLARIIDLTGARSVVIVVRCSCDRTGRD